MDADVAESAGALDASDAAGDGDGDGDAAIPEDTKVTGRVIDYWENPIAGATVTLDGGTTTTDDDGEFAFESAPPRYSITLALTYPLFGASGKAGYLFAGLTRRDPTLQVYRGHPLRRGELMQTIEGATFPLSPNERVAFGLASPYGGTYGEQTAMSSPKTADWEGPSELIAHAHAIHVVDAASGPALPTSYLAHDSATIALQENVRTTYSLDLSATSPLPDGIVSGVVTSAASGPRTDQVFVRFSDDAAVQVIDHGGSSAFAYLVPSIPTSSIAVAASIGSDFFLPYAAAYAEGIAPGATDIELSIPAPATLVTPAPDATQVDGSTSFAWQGEDQVYMLAVTAPGLGETFFVLTADKTVRLPIEPAFRLDTRYLWSVRTHRRFATVDEATGPTGYLDSFCFGRLLGPRRDAAAHTESVQRGFTTRP